jgi:glutaminyl-tRNA synthetase
LFTVPDPDIAPEGRDWKSNISPASLATLVGCKVEPSLRKASPGDRFQFERLGYFCVDADSDGTANIARRVAEGSEGRVVDARCLVFNRTVTLKDEWARMQKRQA